MKRKALLLLIPFAVAGLAGCQSADPGNPTDQCDQAEITLNKTEVTLKVGESVVLEATAPAACSNLGWGVNQAGESVVSLNKDGTTCTVTATSVGTAIVGYGTTASCTITVSDEEVVPVTGVVFDKTSYEVKPDQSVNVLAHVTPENATEKGITYSLKDANPADCATISSNIVTAVKEGTVKVVATSKDGGFTAEATVTIRADAPDPEPVHKGTLDDPYDVNDAVIVGNKLANNATTDKEFYIKGTAETAEFTKYASYSFEIGQGFLCYSLKNGAGQAEFKEGDIAIGDEVTVFAKITKFHQDAKDDKPERTILETKGGYVVNVKKPGEGDPVSIKEIKSGPLEVEQGTELHASDYEITLNLSNGGTKDVIPTGIEVDTSVIGDNIQLKLKYTGLEDYVTTIKVTAPAPRVVGDFYRIKAQAEIVEGTYLIAWEGEEEAKVFNGVDAGHDYTTASFANGHIAANDSLVKVSLEEVTGGFAIKVLNGAKADNYISGKSGSNTIVYSAEPVANTVTHDESGNDVISSNTSTLMFNPNSGDTNDRFRFYKSGSTQNPVHLYKMHEGQPAELVSISVDSSQVKKEYYVGDSLDTTNLVVTAHYDNESEKVITSGYEIDPESFEVAGDSVPVTISYGGKSADPFNVKVNEARTISTVTIVDYPEEITEGDEITADDVLVDVTYSSGDPDEDVHPDSVLLGEVLDGEAELTATVGDVTSSAVKVTVNPVQREALPYTGEVAGGALPAKWELSGSGATFATSYFALKGDGAAITASKLIDEQSAIKVAVKGICNGTSTDSLVTVYALNDADEVVDSDTYVPAKASSTNAAQVEANSTVCEVALAGEGITGVKVELTNKGHNYVLMSVVITEDVPPVPPVLESIEVSTSEHREFYLNDPFVPETILAKYDKGDDVDVTEDALFEDYDMSTAGKQTVKVTYGGKETSYDITVSDAPAPAIKSISINADGMLKEYYDGDDIDLTGVEVYAEYESGDPVKLDEDKYSLVCNPEQADIDSQKTTLTATLLDTEAGVEPATLDVNLTVTAKPAPVEDVVETLTAESLGLASGYNSFSVVSKMTGCLIQGNGTLSNDKGIQIRDTGNKSGIYTRTSDRNIKSIEFEFDSANSKTISVYGQNDGYKEITSTPSGTLLGSVTANGTITVTGEYRNICIVSTGATYIKDIILTWDGQQQEKTVTGVTLNKTTDKVEVDSSTTLSAVVEGIGCSQEVTWESEDTAKATVVDGVVKGVSAGTVNIYAKSIDDDSVVGTCAVTVNAKVSYLAKYDFTKLVAGKSSYEVKDATSASNFVTGLGDCVTSGTNIVSSVSAYSKFYTGEAKDSTTGVKFGTSSVSGSITFNLSTSVKKMIINVAGWTTSDTISVNGGAATTISSEAKGFVEMEFDFGAGVTSITITITNRGLIKSMYLL